MTAGPPTVPQDKDVAKAQRTAAPKAGTDERALVPAGPTSPATASSSPRTARRRWPAWWAAASSPSSSPRASTVEKGDVLAVIDGKPDKAALAAAEADLEQAKADLARTMRGLRKEDVGRIVADTASQKARADSRPLSSTA